MSLQTCLELVRQRGAALPEQVAIHLLCASVWRAAVAGISLRPGRVLLDASEGLILDALHPAGAGSDSGYLAPDAVAGEAAPDAPRSLVYAAGALGHELLSGAPLDLSGPRRELPGKVGEIVRKALSRDPQRRFGSLEEMSQALAGVLPPPEPELERQVFSSLLALCSRWSPEEAPPQIPRNGKDGPTAAQLAALATWVERLDSALERIQRQQLDIAASLALHRAAGPAAARPNDDARARQQMELLQRLTLAASSPRAAPQDARPAQLAPWMIWTGAAVTGSIAAAVVSLALRAPAPTPQPVTPRQAVAAQPTPAVDDAGASRTMQASTLVLATSRPDGGAAVTQRSAPGATKPAIPTPQPVSRLPRAKQTSLRTASSPSAMLESAEAALRAGRTADALAGFQAALAAEPTMAPAVRGMAMAYLLEGKEREAKAAFARYLKLAPNADDAGPVRKAMADLDAKGK